MVPLLWKTGIDSKPTPMEDFCPPTDAINPVLTSYQLVVGVPVNEEAKNSIEVV